MRKILAMSVLIAVACVLLGGWQQQGILAPITGASGAAAGGGTPAFVASWSGGNNQCLTATCNLTVAPAAGHGICVGFLYRSDLGSISSVTYTGSVAMTQIVSVTGLSGGHYGQALYCSASLPSSVTTITVVTNVSADTESVAIEYTVAGATADGASSNTTNSSGGTVSIPSITPGAGDKIALFPTAINPGAAATTFTAGGSYTNLVQSGTSNNDGAQIAMEFLGQASASGSYAAAFTYTPSGNSIYGQIGAVK